MTYWSIKFLRTLYCSKYRKRWRCEHEIKRDSREYILDRESWAKTVNKRKELCPTACFLVKWQLTYKSLTCTFKEILRFLLKVLYFISVTNIPLLLFEMHHSSLYHWWSSFVVILPWSRSFTKPFAQCFE